MKRKVLALTLSLVLICSSTTVIAATEDIASDESGIEIVTGEKVADVADKEGTDKNDNADVSDENTLENIGEGQKDSDEVTVVSFSDMAIAEDDIDFEAVDANGDNYWDSDVELINSLIENNGLNWEEDAPEKWDEMSGGGVRWSTVDVSGLSRISWLVISNEEMTGSIDLSGLERLTYLDCRGNELSGLNVQGCERLEELYCSDNKLSELNLEGLKSLQYLSAERNELEKLDLSGDSGLKSIECSSNNLTELKLSNIPDLKFLNCSENNLTELDASMLESLYQLNCSDNNLIYLNVVGLSELWSLNASRNNLEELELSGLEKLQVLECAENNLKELDVSDLKELKNLDCNSNELTELNLSGLTNMALAFGENGSRTGTCNDNPLKTLTLPAGNTITFDSSDGGYIDVRINPLYASCGQSEEDIVIGFRPVSEPGYEFKSWNNLPENVADSGWWSSPYDGEAVDGWIFTDSGEDITISANFGPISEYSVIEGAGSTWAENTTESITMRADGEFDKFQSVQVDDVTVDPAYYTAEQGSTIITLKPEFLQTLTAGTHTLTILFTDGTASADFIVKEAQEEENPGSQSGEDSQSGDEQQPVYGTDSDEVQQNEDINEGNKVQQISGTDKNDNAGQNQDEVQQNSGQSGNTAVAKVEKTQEASKAVKTGDESNVVIFAVVMIIALMACAVTCGVKIKKRH